MGDTGSLWPCSDQCCVGECQPLPELTIKHHFLLSSCGNPGTHVFQVAELRYGSSSCPVSRATEGTMTLHERDVSLILSHWDFGLLVIVASKHCSNLTCLSGLLPLSIWSLMIGMPLIFYLSPLPISFLIFSFLFFIPHLIFCSLVCSPAFLRSLFNLNSETTRWTNSTNHKNLIKNLINGLSFRGSDCLVRILQSGSC